MGGLLVEGELEGDLVTCHWHSREHNVRTGISLGIDLLPQQLSQSRRNRHEPLTL